MSRLKCKVREIVKTISENEDVRDAARSLAFALVSLALLAIKRRP